MAQRHGDLLSEERRPIVNIAARAAIIGSCAFGLSGIAPIAYQHATGIELCPTLGPVPACYIVLLGYTLAGASMIVGVRIRTALFVTGWLPVFGLAVMGSSMQVLGILQCPKSTGDIPGCFLSLTLATSLIFVFLVERFYRPSRSLEIDRRG